MHAFLTSLVSPRLVGEDERRREFILNVILVGVLALLIAAFAVDLGYLLLDDPERYRNNSLTLAVIGCITASFAGLYALSRAGYVRFVVLMLLGLLYTLPVYMLFRWGFDVPVAALLLVLFILMAGALVHTRAAFVALFLSACAIAVVGHAQLVGLLTVNSFWKDSPAQYGDIIITGVIFALIAGAAWLGNREIEASLRRARASEYALAEERDLLEVRVIERTEELRRETVERMSQSYRFVEFGRIAGGVFHDLAGPLTALSLNIDALSEEVSGRPGIAAFSDDVARARAAALHMQKLIGSIGRHLSGEHEAVTFSPAHALGEALQVLGSYAHARSVTLRADLADEARIYGDPAMFLQIITNVVSNGIESFPTAAAGLSDARTVTLSLQEDAGGCTLRIHDTGPGIAPDIRDRIFEPFFSTKGRTGGMGIGLPLAKHNLEKSFGGALTLVSAPDTGTTFTLYFPHREP